MTFDLLSSSWFLLFFFFFPPSHSSKAFPPTQSGLKCIPGITSTQEREVVTQRCAPGKLGHRPPRGRGRWGGQSSGPFIPCSQTPGRDSQTTGKKPLMTSEHTNLHTLVHTHTHTPTPIPLFLSVSCLCGYGRGTIMPSITSYTWIISWENTKLLKCWQNVFFAFLLNFVFH